MAKNYGLNLDSRLSASSEVYMKREAVNCIFNTYPTLKYLWDNKEMKDGGESISSVITYLANSGVGWLTSPYAVVNDTPQDNETTANDRFRILPGSIVISDEEKRENAGDKIFDLAQQKSKNTMLTMRDTLNAALWASSPATGALNTFQQLADTSTTIHSLAAASYWQGTSTTSGSFASQGLDDMRTTWNTISNEGSEDPTFIVTTRTAHEYFEKFGTGKSTYNPPVASQSNLNLGFGSLSFRGVPVVYDLDAPSGTMYFINTNYTKLVIDSGMNMKVNPFIRPKNSLAQTALVALRCQLFTTKRPTLGRMTSITA